MKSNKFISPYSIETEPVKTEYNVSTSGSHLEQMKIYAVLQRKRICRSQDKKLDDNKKATGNYQNEHSWLYDPVAVMKIRINGQLLLLMLTEMLISIGAKIKQLNTDGVLYVIKKDAPLDETLKKWEEITKLTLETEYYEAFYQFAINDYLAIGQGYSETKNKKLIKQKGLFIDRVSLGKGMQPMIIPKALNAYFADKVPVKDTIYGSKNINDFLTYQKADKKFAVEYNEELITRINRYYASTDGAYLYKCVVVTNDVKIPAVILHFKNGNTMKVPKTDVETNGKYWYSSDVESVEETKDFIVKKGTRTDYSNMLKASGVTIVNNLNDIKEFPKNINYAYYISECNKIISAFENIQLSLF